jgi:hypothetical protein
MRSLRRRTSPSGFKSIIGDKFPPPYIQELERFIDVTHAKLQVYIDYIFSRI